MNITKSLLASMALAAVSCLNAAVAADLSSSQKSVAAPIFADRGENVWWASAGSQGLPKVHTADTSSSQFVQDAASAENKITTLVFKNVPPRSLSEGARFSLRQLPESETFALILAGLGAIGFISRRRRSD
jgi:hypothetical protein